MKNVVYSPEAVRKAKAAFKRGVLFQQFSIHTQVRRISNSNMISNKDDGKPKTTHVAGSELASAVLTASIACHLRSAWHYGYTARITGYHNFSTAPRKTPTECSSMAPGETDSRWVFPNTRTFAENETLGKLVSFYVLSAGPLKLQCRFH